MPSHSRDEYRAQDRDRDHDPYNDRGRRSDHDRYDRSRDRDRERDRDRDRDHDRRRGLDRYTDDRDRARPPSSERHRDRDRDRNRDREFRERDRDRERHRERDRERDRGSRRSLDRSPDRRDCSPQERNGRASRHSDPQAESGRDDRAAGSGAGPDDELKKKMAAWKAKKAALDASKSAPPVPARPPKSGAAATLFGAADDDDEEPAVFEPQKPSVADEFYRKQREDEKRSIAEMSARAAEEDALDAFMTSEVMPEVSAHEAEQQKRELEAKKALLEQIQSGKLPKADPIIDEDEEKEEPPDLVVQVPKHKVKLIVGPGGERIKQIQRRTKTRIQIQKDQNELERGFGTGPNVRVAGKVAAIAAKLTNQVGGEIEKATIMIYGEADRCAQAKSLLLEAVENKEQKQKQRQKEYDKKREEKQRNRQIYYMRHGRDYEVMGVPVGTSKAELTKVFKQLRMKWHPDKNPNNREEAEKKFIEISKAYESLMTTDEEESIKAISGKV